MWSQVESDLAEILTAKIYHALLIQDPVYRSFLRSAGLGPNFPDDRIPAALRDRFAEAARVRAHIIVIELKSLKALDEDSCGAKLVKGTAEFYRFWDSHEPDKRTGPWWFEQNVMTVCRREAGKTAEDRQNWLRAHLAVSLDWSKMDRVDIMTLSEADELPAVVGKGLPQRMWSPQAIPEGKAAGKDYWPNYTKQFPGGLRQTVFPFIPRVRGEDRHQFLSRG